jgi:hypothetical protein
MIEIVVRSDPDPDHYFTVSLPHCTILFVDPDRTDPLITGKLLESE